MAEAGLYVHYGCHWIAPDQWINFDASPTLRFERIPILGRLYTKNARRFPSNVRYGDIIQGLPLPPGSARGVYASHVLEHMSRTDFEKALRNTLNLLMPGGIFRLIVPDLEARARRYIEAVEHGDPTAADTFMRSVYLGKETRARGLSGVIMEWLGNSAHLWMYDRALMAAALSKAGFVDIRPCILGDCIDPMFNLVEDAGRFIDDGIREVAMEARRAA